MGMQNQSNPSQGGNTPGQGQAQNPQSDKPRGNPQGDKSSDAGQKSGSQGTEKEKERAGGQDKR